MKLVANNFIQRNSKNPHGSIKKKKEKNGPKTEHILRNTPEYLVQI